ncbi:phenoloxidase subunit 1-like [Ostrinia nubilalis]|uniref:phenoloxidase subunit 1-like n=1 Tax=Ostrinia nubilalis TaxID=29057 RepID=UPI0030822687
MADAEAKKNLLLFFDRPTEPCFMQKGDDKSVFQLPEHYYPDKYRALSTTLSDRFGTDDARVVPVANIGLPDLSVPMQLPYNEQFSLFIQKHREMAGNLIDTFVGMRNVEDLTSLCTYCQLRINPYMFNYCLSVALLHRDDTKGFNVPTLVQTFPDKFMDPKVFRKAREVSNVVTTGSRMPVEIPTNLTASELEPEQRVAYFREDIGVNLHHWHWHLVYPFETDFAIVNKDRRGELLYYMHQQIIARYTSERFCNGLGRVVRYTNFRAPIEEAYFPKLDSQVASRAWPPRFAGSVLRDLDRPVDRIRIEVSELERWRDRVLQAIEENAVIVSGNRKVPLTEETGIDVLGNLMESSILSPNRGYYGDLHNMGHVICSYAHDPDHRHLEQYGVMGDSTTAMRDPFFYRWHAFVDDVFDLHKTKLPKYGNDRLDFPGIRVSSISVEGPAGSNTFGTQWEQSMVDLARGLDFTPRGSVLAKFTHLQHDEFTYVIEVNNTSGAAAMGMFRIFLAPVNDESGQPLRFEEQRRLFIELDKFSQPLNAGNNTIRRNSVDSSVTIPYERTFMDQTARPGDPGSAAAAEFDFCGCGWPHHMLIPKGTPQGFPMVLFVMVSNWNDDRVEQDTVGTCNDAASYCGIRDRKYPDKRAMGFPFDRPPQESTLSDFLRPNMSIRQCTVKFTDATRIRQQRR